MGALKDSMRKSKLMQKIARADARYQDTDELMEELWDMLFKFPSIQAVIDKHGYTLDQFKDDHTRILNHGYGWENGNYIPLSILCFAKPLDFFLANKEKDELSFSGLIYATKQEL